MTNIRGRQDSVRRRLSAIRHGRCVVTRHLFILTLLLTLSGNACAAEEQDSPAAPTASDADAESSIDQQSAGEHRSLTLSDLEGLAFRHHPTLAAAVSRMNSARGRHLQAGLYPNPTAGYHATQVGNRGTSGQQGAFIRQRFITGDKLKLDQAIAGKEISEAHFQFHSQQQRVLSDVRVRFHEALTAQRRVKVTGELARIGEDIVTATETLVEGRLGTENDLLQAEISADQSQILADNAVNEHQAAWRRLAVATGLAQLESTELSGTLDDELMQLDWESCRITVLTGHPELAAARARAARAAIAVRRAKQEPIPDIDLGVSVRRNNIIGRGEAVTNVELGIPVPIFDRNQGNICSAEAEWVLACQEVKRIELNLQDRLAIAFRRYTNARQQVQRYGQRMLPKAKRSLSLVKNGYQNGQVEYLTMLTAQQTYLQITLSYLDALQELQTAADVIEARMLTNSLANHP